MRATPAYPTRWSRDGWARLAAAPPSVAALVLLLYALWLGIILPHSHGARDFINIGRGYILRGHGSALIRVDPYVASLANPGGFDGQFAYYIALDPLHATTYLDEPSYRLARILYPVLGRTLALGQPAAVPYALLAINWLALGGGTLALAAWLRRHKVSAWFALIYGLYPGFLEGLRYDLTEPLCYALVALAIYLTDFGGPRRVLWAGLAFALAALARESALFFAIPYGLAQLFARPTPAQTLADAQPEPSMLPDATVPTRQQSRAIPPTDGSLSYKTILANLPPAAALLAIATLPLLAWRVFLYLRLGTLGTPGWAFQSQPFAGFRAYYPWAPAQMEEIRSVVLPAAICALIALWALWRRCWAVEIWILLLNIWLFVVLLAPGSVNDYLNSGRISAGVVLAALTCIPHFDRLSGGNRWWLWSSAALWLSLAPFWLLVPIADSLLTARG